MFWQSISTKFTVKNIHNKSSKEVETSNLGKKAEISRILSSILPRSSKKVFFQKKGKNSTKSSNNKNIWLYIQVSSSNIKENFPNLSLEKIKKVHKTINEPRKIKPRINMTIKEPLRRQVIVPMSTNNA